MTDTMIERIARAALDDLAKQDTDDGPWLMENGMVDYIDQQPVDMHSLARAILTAMRDFPDQLGNHLPDGYKPGSHSARDIWKSIIDAALAEGA